ncbi:MAG: hypothetical protein JW958_04030 [Candidatus Eisenbacteria bacterium]|nr:hypothetical protein [Candidatus Eisenbacteria bacterium]
MRAPPFIAALLLAGFLPCATSAIAAADPPPSYDLRDVEGISYVTSVKSQIGGTCWAHATMAALEGNLLRTGVWVEEGEAGEPDLAEYHLDWWNGFNRYWNGDLPDPSVSGLTVHQGGDYLVAAAYLARGEGAVRNGEGQSYGAPPLRVGSSYHYYAPRHVEWLTAGPDSARVDRIKRAVMEYGPVAACMLFDSDYMHDNAHYQPPGDDHPPNHAVAIVGWDDAKATAAPEPGAWLCKNSHGDEWGLAGYFWISYFDRWCGSEPWMGAVLFRDVRRTGWDHVYHHDLHGWRDVLEGVKEARNRFVAGEDERIGAVGFVTAAENVEWAAYVEDGRTGRILAEAKGFFERPGVHVVDLNRTASLSAGLPFNVRVLLSAGGHPYDRTSDVPVLLGSSGRPLVESRARTGESLYRDAGRWIDLTTIDSTANFCIKAYARLAGLEVSPMSGFGASGPVGGPFVPAMRSYSVRTRGGETIDYAVEIDPPVSWLAILGTTEGVLPPGAAATVLLRVDPSASALPAGAHATSIRFVNRTDGLGETTLPAVLAVGDPAPQVEWTMDADPGWDAEGEWAWGVPAGGGGETGGADPAAGFTGARVFGYALEGDYPNDLPERRLTTGPIDCGGRFGVRLRYRRWLGVEGPQKDAASLEVSPDGAEWFLLWANVSMTADTGWVLCEHDISYWADDRPEVRLRWTMGPTDGAGRCCGWNLDDVEILSLPIAGATGVGPWAGGRAPAAIRIAPVRPNPCNPFAEIRFDLSFPSHSRVAVYDPTGRLVRLVFEGRLPSGAHAMRWDGRDGAGRPAASGVYFVRAEAHGVSASAKMVLLR